MANYQDGSYNITYAWDNAGRLAATTADGRSIAYQYDAAGNRTRTNWPEAPPFYVTTAYDALNRLTAINELGSTNLATPSKRVSGEFSTVIDLEALFRLLARRYFSTYCSTSQKSATFQPAWIRVLSFRL